MKILTVAYLHGAGGAERQIILLSNEMAKKGHDVHMIILNENECHYTISEDIKVHDLSANESRPLRIIKRFLAFRKEIGKIQPEVTINYNLQGAYFSLLVGRKACGKIIYSERGDPYDDEYSGLLGKVRDITCKHVNGLVFQSEGARDFFTITQKQKAIVIHNSITVPQDKYPIPEKRDNRIVTVGRLHPQKNPWLLVDAFSLIAQKYPDVTLEFYGDGALKEEIQAKINRMGLAGRIHLNPSRINIFDCIRTARLFVLPSDYEGMPNALMEAMSLGLPSIATDCRPGGARTLIEDGINGFIVPVRNPLVMAQKISFILDNPDEAEKIGRTARILGKTHTSEIVFERWNHFIMRL